MFSYGEHVFANMHPTIPVIIVEVRLKSCFVTPHRVNLV